jgi:ABC-type dipeptide/oligopeptide/nickel transport system permease component
MDAKRISLTTYTGRRIFGAIPLLVGTLVVTFVLVHVAPGDPTSILAGEHTTPEHQVFIREQFGLDRPLWERFWFYVRRVAQGDLGHSYASGRPVVVEIGERIPPTLLLILSAVLFSAGGGVLLGVVASRQPGSPLDIATVVGCLIFHSIPVFWLGQLLLLTMALTFDLFPVQGMVSVRRELRGVSYLFDLLHHLALPALTLGLHHVGLIARVTRASMVEVLGEEFIRTARAKGISETLVLGKHALGNALTPVVNVLGTQLATLFVGAVLTETVFGWPGLGRLFIDAAFIRDYPLLLGLFLVITVGVITANLLADLVCAGLDPRVKVQ